MVLALASSLPPSVSIGLDRVAGSLDKTLGAEAVPTLHRALLAMREQGADAALLDATVRHAAVLAPRLLTPAGLSTWLTAVQEVAALDAVCATAMLDSSDEVLRHGPPAELLMWARLGLRHAHGRARARRDGDDARLAHFRLRSRESALIMSPQGRAVDLAATQPRLEHWLRVLFDIGPAILPIEHALATKRPYLSNLGLHLPESGRAQRGQQATAWYDAAAAHAGAHLVHSTQRFAVGNLKPIQTALVGVLEDARVERLAACGLPGLRRLWLGFHLAEPAHGGSFVVLMLRLARGLLDPAHADPHPWVAKGRAQFEAAWQAATPHGAIDPAVLRAVAANLGNDIGQMRLQFNAREYVVEPAYRDDNANLWLPPDDAQPQSLSAADAAPQPPTPPDSAAEPPPSGAPGDAPELSRHRYPEWDRLAGAYRPDWCSVIECSPPAASAEALASVATDHAAMLARLERLMRAHRPRERVTRRAQLRGEALDLDATVRSAIDRRTGRSPSDKVHQRIDRHRRSWSTLLLLDTSASTADPVGGTDRSVLAIAREAALLTGLALERGGDRCAIHAFCSNGRHEVRYESLKEFDEPLDVRCITRLAGLRSRLSTRFGAGIRHATQALAAERSAQRLLLMVTDGEPYDIDIHDRRYLIEDARRSVLEAARHGVMVFCVTVDGKANETADKTADAYLREIFGPHGFRVLDHVDALPEVLPQTVMRLAR